MFVYPPGDDSRIVGKALAELVSPGMRILDMGTGSGYLALIARSKGGNVLAVDLNPDAVKEVEKLGIQSRVSDMFSNVPEKFDLIVFNPPYLELSEEERDSDSSVSIDGGKNGREVLDRFIRGAKAHLNADGKILFFQLERNGVTKTKELLKNQGYKFRVMAKSYIPMEGWGFVFLAWRDQFGH